MSGIVGTSSSKSKIVGKSEDTAIAWCNFNGDSGAVFRNNFGFSSVTRSTAGRYNLTFIKAMGSDGAVVGAVSDDLDAYGGNRGICVSNRNGGDGAGIKLTTFTASNATEGDMTDISVVVFGD